MGLPFGLLYTHILSPVFYGWLLVKKRRPLLLGYLCVIIPYDIIHLWLGVEWKSFLVSNLLLLSTYIFTLLVSYVANNYTGLGKVFRQLLVANFIMTLVALAVLFTPYREWLWYVKKFTASVENLPCLDMMTYEASYYSFMFVPIAVYYLLKVFFRQTQMNPAYLLVLVLVPLFLSLSVGVIGAMVLAFMGMYIIHWEKIFYRKSFFYPLLLVIIGGFCCTVLLMIFFPHNPVFVRIANIFNGADTSAAGRTFDSFRMANMIAEKRSIWFGTGLGQIKILAPEIVKEYFNYWGELEVIRIPNTVAETYAIFGITGLVFRFALIAWLFFKTRVLQNYYRTLLFLFVFIYQFTGSFITNIVEYVIWALAFSQVFPEFDVKEKRKP